MHPETPGDDPFEALPPQIREMLEQIAGPGGLDAMREQLDGLLGPDGLGRLLSGDPSALGDLDLGPLGGLAGFGPLGGLGAFGGPGPTGMGSRPVPDGPVDWELATSVALEVAAAEDRAPTDEERARTTEAFRIAEHWLDTTPLPSPPDAGRVVVASRQEWINGAVVALRPLVEPVAASATDALVELARDQFGQLRDAGGADAMRELFGGDEVPEGFADMLGQVLGQDPDAMIRPAGAVLAGLQAGQVLGQLATQLLGQYGLGVPTAPRDQAEQLVVNVADTFAGYDIDPTEVAIALALSEAAHRRLYHAVPWLEGHVRTLVSAFAQGTVVDVGRLREITEERLAGVDPSDPDALREAMERAADFHLEPTDAQRRVLERLQGLVCVVGAWARQEVARASAGRLPSLARIEEVLRRQRALRGDGDDLLASLLGLNLRPDDEALGERFVAAVEEALGPAGLRRALAHPDYLPDAEELAEPERWLARTTEDVEVPDDLASLLSDAGEVPHEATAAERQADARRGQDGEPSDGDPADGGPSDGGPSDGGPSDGGPST